MYLIILALGVCTASDAIEVLLINSLSSSLTFQATFNRTETEFSTTSSLTFLGMFFGGILAALLNSKIGLRKLLLASLLSTLTVSLLTNLATALPVYNALRLITGLSIGATIPPTFTLVSLHSPPEARGRNNTLVAWFWMIGSVYISCVAYYIFEYTTPEIHWHIFNVICSLPSAAAFLLVYFHVPQPANIDRGPANPLRTARSLYDSPAQRKRTVGLQLCWFCLSFTTFSLLSIITPLFSTIGISSNYLSTVIFSSAALVGNVGSYFAIDTMSRRRLLIASLLAAAVSTVLLAISGSAPLIIACACLFQIASTSAWNVVDTVSSEQFPEKESKTTGFGLCSATGRLGAFAAQFANVVLIDRSVNGLLLADGLALVIAAGAVWWGLDEEVRYWEAWEGGERVEEKKPLKLESF